MKMASVRLCVQRILQWISFYFLMLFVVVTTSAEENETCENAVGGGKGICITTQRCEPVMKFIKGDDYVMSSQTLNLLHDGHCGFLGDQPLICCPNNKTPIKFNLTKAAAPAKSNTPLGNTIVSERKFVVSLNDPQVNLLPIDSCGVSMSNKIALPPNVLHIWDTRPTIARLFYTAPNGSHVFHCGGSLICDKYILTAAHCILGLPNRSTVSGVVLGDYDLTMDPDCEMTLCRPPVQRRNVETTIVHPEYNATSKRNDIALLRLNRSANFSSDLDLIPVCLPVGDQQFEEPPTSPSWPTWLRTNGWGTVRNGTYLFPKRKYGVVRADNSTLCNNPKFDPISQLCVEGRHNIDARVVDSGGPLMLITNLQPEDGPRMIQIGVESFIIRPSTHGASPLRVFTRVGPHLKWILDNIKL